MQEKTKIKRLSVDMTPELHQQIKARAVFRNTTIRKYIIEAVIERIKNEEKYQ